MRRRLAFLAVIFAAQAAGGLAEEDAPGWILEESENFRLEVENNEKLARETSKRIEAFYVLLRDQLQALPGPSNAPRETQGEGF